MAWALDSLILEGPRVQIRNFERSEIPEIARATYDPDGWCGKELGHDSLDKLETWLGTQLDEREKGGCQPLIYLTLGKIAGYTSFHRIDPVNRRLEIGRTCVSPAWRRTYVNTEVKYLLLKHSFETLSAIRVEFRVSPRNMRSQEAVLRLGATQEGLLRAHQIGPQGDIRDYYIYSVIQSEWDQIRRRLLDKLNST